MANLLQIKNIFNLSDEKLVVRWCENILWKFFSSLDYNTSHLLCDASLRGRFLHALGEAGLGLPHLTTIETADAIEAVKPQDRKRVMVDSTAQEKAIAHHVHDRLFEFASHKVASRTEPAPIGLKQTFAKESKTLRWKAGCYAHPNGRLVNMNYGHNRLKTLIFTYYFRCEIAYKFVSFNYLFVKYKNTYRKNITCQKISLLLSFYTIHPSIKFLDY
jgi:hypothetical protein